MGSDHVLVCRVGERRCALPLDAVIETMRPLPIHPVEGVTEAVLGVCIIRGLPTPVLDLAVLFAERAGDPQRFVTIRTSSRVVALAVDEVIGVQAVNRASLQTLPPLLGDARTSAIDAIGAADDELMVVLRAARLVPADAIAEESPR